MNLLSCAFFGFFIVFFAIYYIVPHKYRYIVIFIGSYVFYGFGHPIMISTLLAVTIISYFGGLIIEKKKSKTAYRLFFMLVIVILVFFKYTGFILKNISKVQDILGINTTKIINWKIILPVGLSFIVFQSCAYLSDVYRGRIRAEKNIIRFAAFSAFFPTVLSGPIQKARNLLPQIQKPKSFDYEQAHKGLVLFIWGAFEKLLVSNNLNSIVTIVLGDYKHFSSAQLLIGACCFSLYIYSDFSAYSDMARGIAKLLNIDVGKNFNNPYLSKSTGEFWNRWHISLNEWFVDNVYIPLGGNRKGLLRKYLNVLIVFIISGLWHGAEWHFVIWGLLNGLLVIIGQLLYPLKNKIYKFIGVSEDVESIVFIKRFVVFGLITLTWMFFNSGAKDAIAICKKILVFDFVSIFNPEILNIRGSAVSTFITIVVTVIFCVIQNKRQNEFLMYEKLKKQPFVFQCLLLAVIICWCIFAVCDVDANVDANFLYYDF